MCGPVTCSSSRPARSHPARSRQRSGAAGASPQPSQFATHASRGTWRSRWRSFSSRGEIDDQHPVCCRPDGPSGRAPTVSSCCASESGSSCSGRWSGRTSAAAPRSPGDHRRVHDDAAGRREVGDRRGVRRAGRRLGVTVPCRSSMNDSSSGPRSGRRRTRRSASTRRTAAPCDRGSGTSFQSALRCTGRSSPNGHQSSWP